MSLDEHPNIKDMKDDLSFVVTTDPRNIASISDTPKYANPGIGFVCTASTEELRNQWVKTIKDILQKQRDFLKAIQSPIAYQKERTKQSWVSKNLAYLDLGWY